MLYYNKVQSNEDDATGAICNHILISNALYIFLKKTPYTLNLDAFGLYFR